MSKTTIPDDDENTEEIEAPPAPEPEQETTHCGEFNPAMDVPPGGGF